ncbi:MAG: serine hydrolase [Anaerolineae bacterium]|nr:serine hydrolase [Anaerolineae bacterium]NUQ07130.1 serine hydrolase [Anaerolineae bacterium]
MKEFAGFDAFLREIMEAWHIPGAAVAVVRDGALVYAEGFGYRDVENQLPVTPETLFAIGSSSKAFTATAAGIMVDDGKLDWHTPIRKWLPAFELKDRFATERMTLADLLCHRSGLPRHDLLWYNAAFSREALIDRFKYLEPTKDFRTFLQYQNLMYLTAGYLSGVANETSWETLIEERLFKPLEMRSSNLSVTRSQESDNHALPYEMAGLRSADIKRVPFRNIDTVGPAGSINANVIDMANWLIMNLSGGRFKDQQVVAEATLAEIHSVQMPIIPAAMMFPPLDTHPEVGQAGYGFGWFIQQYRGHRWIHHGGSIDGFVALVSMLPTEKIGVVVLTNLGGRMTPPIIACNIQDRLLGLEPMDWNTAWREFHDKIIGAVEEANGKLLSARIPDTQPSHRLEDYAGEYEHPGYGVVRIECGEEGLAAIFNERRLPLEHHHYDTFLSMSDAMPAAVPVAFSLGVDGAVSAVSIPFEPSVEAIRFTRKPPPEQQAPAESDTENNQTAGEVDEPVKL